jgi:transcription elongation factor Elf1
MEKKITEPGYVWIPYVIAETTENKPSEEYNEFMREYELQHKCCPKCGHHECSSTLVGYILYMDKKDEYKDLNKCVCSRCGDRHTTHDRVPLREGYTF